MDNYLGNHQDWSIEDKFPSQEFDKIEPISERLRSMYARADKSKLKFTALNIVSVIWMVEALEYHLSRFKELSVNTAPDLHKLDISKEKSLEIKNAQFEAAAYINTVGQLYYWTISISGSAPAKITEVTESFRHKNTAHSSWHFQKEYETPYVRDLHAMLFRGSLRNSNKELIFQIQKIQGQSVELNLLKDHLIILKEVEINFEAMLQ